MSQAENSTLPTASSPIRMRVQGMDCAKDAAEMTHQGEAEGWEGEPWDWRPNVVAGHEAAEE